MNMESEKFDFISKGKKNVLIHYAGYYNRGCFSYEGSMNEETVFVEMLFDK